MAKRYEELTILDDFMFGKEMGDKVLCRDVLERLLEEKVGELEDVQPQREFRYTSGGKPVRLDMYTRDKKRMYDAALADALDHLVEDAGARQVDEDGAEAHRQQQRRLIVLLDGEVDER